MKTLKDKGNVYSSVDELARDLGISLHTAYEGLRKNDIPNIRLGRRFLVPRSAIAEWLKNAGPLKPQA
jgi:excisionase family DNA binding protein